MFDLAAPGVTVRPIGRLDGKPAFAELFLDEVFVPDEDVIGEPGQGWRVAMSTAGNERGLTLRRPGRFIASADRLAALWRDDGRPVGHGAAGPGRGRGDRGARVRAVHLRGRLAPGRGGERRRRSRASTRSSGRELDIALHETALDLLGPDGELSTRDRSWAEGYVFSLAGPIYAGTNEIQRDIIAERLLGLPKGRR